MQEYYIRLEGPSRERQRITCDTIDEARNEAIRYLGTHLTTHSQFATDGHWRVIVEDVYGKSILYVIVAAVMASQKKPEPR